MVGAWIASVKSGKSGLREDARQIMLCMKNLVKGLTNMKFEILGDAKVKSANKL